MEDEFGNRQNVHQCMRFHKKWLIKTDSRRLDFKKVRVNAARMLIDLVRSFCYVGLQMQQPIGTAVCRKALVILRRSCYAGLQLGFLDAL